MSQNCKQDPKIMEDEDEYCAVCGDSEFDEDGYETHEDEDEYDHDFVYEEDYGLTLDDVKELADTAASVFKAAKAFKDISEDSKPKKGYHETSTPRPSASDGRKPGWWIFTSKKEKSGVEEKLDTIEKKIDQSSKHQNRKWYIGIGIAIGLVIITSFFL